MGDAAEQIATAEPAETTEATAPEVVTDAPGDGATPAESTTDATTEAPAEETPATEEPKKESETALFRKALKMREEAVTAKAKAAADLADARRARDEVRQLRAQVEEREAKLKAIEKDPWAFFELMKVDPNDFARRMMDLQDPIRRELETERQKREELEKKWEDERKQREATEAQHRVAVAKSNFVSFIAQKAAEFPDVADEDEGEVAAVFWDLASEHYKNTGEIPAFEMVARYMQQQADRKRATREQRRQQRMGGLKPANPGGGNSAPQRTAQTGQPANGPGPRAPSTLTNADASTRASVPRADATQDEIDAWAAQELRKAFRKDADT